MQFIIIIPFLCFASHIPHVSSGKKRHQSNILTVEIHKTLSSQKHNSRQSYCNNDTKTNKNIFFWKLSHRVQRFTPLAEPNEPNLFPKILDRSPKNTNRRR